MTTAGKEEIIPIHEVKESWHNFSFKFVVFLSGLVLLAIFVFLQILWLVVRRIP